MILFLPPRLFLSSIAAMGVVETFGKTTLFEKVGLELFELRVEQVIR